MFGDFPPQVQEAFSTLPTDSLKNNSIRMASLRETIDEKEALSNSNSRPALVQDSSQTPDMFEFLKELTSTKKHYKKTFYQHLYNVYCYLKAQSLPEEVCNAGLFHSIYGTEFYDFQSAAITRDVVRGYIGEYAEELVYIYCGLRKDRFRSIINNAPGWGAQQHLDLCRMEYANFEDVKENPVVWDRMERLRQVIAGLERET